ncbi:kinesin-like protein [Favolaschia claudopus]|uniref:Kinesin-like protein n=1 Tax=Favolaschia claudopus TaxID=2862362 RepID=A0AAV9ZCD8_9AGAR
MSRLPRPHSSPDSKSFAPTLKRKAPEEDDIEQQPSKKPTSGFRPARPLQASRNGTNSSSSSSTAAPPTTALKGPSKPVMPRTLTRPNPPAAARPTARGASAPAVRKPSSGIGAGLPSRVPSSSLIGKRSTSASAAAPDVITNLHKRLTTLETARTQDTERLATLLESHPAASSSSSAAAAIDVQAELFAVQAQLAGTTTQLNSVSAQLVAAQTDLSTTRASEGEARREVLALKAEVLAGKTAVAAAHDETGELRRAMARAEEDAEIRGRRAERMLREVKDELEEREAQVVKLKGEVGGLRRELAETVSAEVGLQERYRALEGRAERLAGEVKELRGEREEWEEERRVLREEAVRGEEERRKLHGMVMELKGNIRVFCRVRPVLPSEATESVVDAAGDTPGAVAAQIAYPDSGVPYPSGQKEIVLSSMGQEREWDAGMGNKPRKEVWGFGFDRVFAPSSTQADLFAEISQLAQSCTDGYNVCIFAYGQTGSGKSWTMEGGDTEETKGMIPRAVEQVFRVAEDLKDKGWTYTMEGQFLEIYNETITDLLSPTPSPGDPPRKHEIHHHPTTHLTTVSDALSPAVTSPTQVMALLAQAQGRRRVAATVMNERSSRSHSVFTLRIRGVHAGGEQARVGTLNLVDLAGSERLGALGHHMGAGSGSGSGAGLGASVMGGGERGERLKETQSINRSLSALGDVVAALGSGPGAHVPYRNSKLTYLLQNSLSGNSKTLMVLNLSPLAAHLNESLTSLRFATKVNNTTIGTAKKVQVQGGKS